MGRFTSITALLCLLAWPAGGFAGTISMETVTRTEVSGRLLKVFVVNTNRGTATAFDVRTRISMLGEERTAPVRVQLKPGESYEDQFRLDIASIGRGRFPLVVRTDFHDANRYPFSGIAATAYRTGEDVRADVIAMVKDMDLGGAAEVPIHLKNLATSPLEIRARLYAPREIEVFPPEAHIRLGARSESGYAFQVSNFSALEGAEYPMYCVVEYDFGGAHHTEIARTQVSIVARANFFRRHRNVWTVLAAALFALLIGMTVWSRRKGAAVHSDSPQGGAGPGP